MTLSPIWFGRRRTGLRRFQRAVAAWYDSLFVGTPEEHNDKTIFMRFYEEVTELMQVGGLTREDLIRQIDYTYSRPVGTAKEEVAGTSITFQHVATRLGVDIQDVSVAELARISTPEMRKKIYDKQAYKRDNGLSA